jgi:hypothetical protein
MNPDDFGCLRSVMVPTRHEHRNGPATSLSDVPEYSFYLVPKFRDGHSGCAIPTTVDSQVQLSEQPETGESMYISQRRFPTGNCDSGTSYSSTHSPVSGKTFVIAERSIGFEARLRIETRGCPGLFEERVCGEQVRQISLFRSVCFRGRLLLALVQRPGIAIMVFITIDLLCRV